jgi:hypothetical protein
MLHQLLLQDWALFLSEFVHIFLVLFQLVLIRKNSADQFESKEN